MLYGMNGAHWNSLRTAIERAEKAKKQGKPKQNLLLENGILKEKLYKIQKSNESVIEWFHEYSPTLNRMFSPKEINHLVKLLENAK